MQRAVRLKLFNFRGMDGAPAGFLLSEVESLARAKGIPWDDGTINKWTVLAEAFQADFDKRQEAERKRSELKTRERVNRRGR